MGILVDMLNLHSEALWFECRLLVALLFSRGSPFFTRKFCGGNSIKYLRLL